LAADSAAKSQSEHFVIVLTASCPYSQRPLTFSENNLSSQTLERIEQQLRLMNVNMADANDIATLMAFPSIPADLDNDSRKVLQRLRDRVMERAKNCEVV